MLPCNKRKFGFSIDLGGLESIGDENFENYRIAEYGHLIPPK